MGHDLQVMESQAKSATTMGRIASLGVGEVGRRYLAALRAGDSMDTWWIVEAVWFGHDESGCALPTDLRWQLVMAALNACPEDDGDLWLLGDGPFDQLAENLSIVERFYAERERNPKLRRLFTAMRRELPTEGSTHGWWFH